MKQVLLKIGMFSFFGLFSLLLISETKPSLAFNFESSNVSKTFLGIVNTTEFLNEKAKVVTFFEEDRNHNSSSFLKLELVSIDPNLTDTIEILISKKHYGKKISKGTYLISQKEKRNINKFYSIFGYANIYKLGELPFFAREGKVQIIEDDNTKISGTLLINLKNANGQFITLEGDFTALKKND